MDMINVAFLNAATAIGATAGGEYPFITFSSSSQLFSIYFPTVYITGGATNPGFHGKMGKTQYFTKALLPNDIMNLYQQRKL